MDWISIIGFIASVFSGISLLPQLIKLIKEKESKDLSFGMLGSLLIGLVFWVLYGCFKKDLIIIISNSFSLLLNVIISILSLKYKKKEY